MEQLVHEMKSECTYVRERTSVDETESAALTTLLTQKNLIRVGMTPLT
jgi:hypothetical protein